VTYKTIWKAKIPEKVKIFMWLVFQRAIITKENMIRRNWLVVIFVISLKL
jgi:hypothetical protein